MVGYLSWPHAVLFIVCKWSDCEWGGVTIMLMVAYPSPLALSFIASKWFNYDCTCKDFIS